MIAMKRRNSDEQLRALERSAATGDESAQTRVLVERMRAGSLNPERVLVAAVLGDVTAREVMPGWRKSVSRIWLDDMHLDARTARRPAHVAYAASRLGLEHIVEGPEIAHVVYMRGLQRNHGTSRGWHEQRARTVSRMERGQLREAFDELRSLATWSSAAEVGASRQNAGRQMWAELNAQFDDLIALLLDRPLAPIVRRNMDESLRGLERGARQGDPAALRRYWVALARAGVENASFDRTNPDDVQVAIESWIVDGLSIPEAVERWTTLVSQGVPRLSGSPATRYEIRDYVVQSLWTLWEALRGAFDPDSDERTGMASDNLYAAGLQRRHASTPGSDDTANRDVLRLLVRAADELERSADMNPVKWPRWIVLYEDNPNGYWYNPSSNEVVEYSYVDDAHGVVLETGDLFCDTDRMLDATRSASDEVIDVELLVAALDIADHEDSRTSRWLMGLVAEAADRIKGHYGYDGGRPTKFFITEEDVEQAAWSPRVHWMAEHDRETVLDGAERARYLSQAQAIGGKLRGVSSSNVTVVWRVLDKREGLIQPDVNAALNAELVKLGVKPTSTQPWDL